MYVMALPFLAIAAECGKMGRIGAHRHALSTLAALTIPQARVILDRHWWSCAGTPNPTGRFVSLGVRLNWRAITTPPTCACRAGRAKRAGGGRKCETQTSLRAQGDLAAKNESQGVFGVNHASNSLDPIRVARVSPPSATANGRWRANARFHGRLSAALFVHMVDTLQGGGCNGRKQSPAC